MSLTSEASTPTRIFHFAGWSTYLSAGLSIISGIFLFLFYALEAPRMNAADPNAPQVLGTLNDIATVFQMLCMLPLAVALHRLAPPDRGGLSLTGAVIGVVGLLGVVIAQALLVAKVLSFEVNLPIVMAAYGLFGVWVFMANQLARTSGSLSSRLGRLGEATGLAFILMSAIVLLVELINWRDPSALARFEAFVQKAPALIAVSIILAVPLILAFFLAVPLWLIGLGRRLFAIGNSSAPAPG
ncbi:MAG TPA: hypothetical protein VJR48_02545, partial [Ktedonobacterales bacterium]|nr:hypothetical protein [Ktedonobacterales bacterium]